MDTGGSRLGSEPMLAEIGSLVASPHAVRRQAFTSVPAIVHIGSLRVIELACNVTMCTSSIEYRVTIATQCICRKALC